MLEGARLRGVEIGVLVEVLFGLTSLLVIREVREVVFDFSILDELLVDRRG